MTVVSRRGALTNGSELPESPIWILRQHTPNPIHQLRIIKPENASSVGLLLAAGDSQGCISLTSLRDYRPRYFWNAHKESILGIDVLSLGKDNVLISTGRDNQMHVFTLSSLSSLTSEVLPSRIQAELPVPNHLQSLDINALNYCSFSTLTSIKDELAEVLVALPHTVDSGYIDMYDLASKKRLATSIGKADMETNGVKASRAAIVMSLQMLKTKTEDTVRIVAGYEDGYVKQWKVQNGSATLEWSERKHSESVMALAVSKDEKYCISVAADHLVVRYEMQQEGQAKTIRSNSAGNACVAIREDDEVIAIGGWDGCVRLYDANLVQLGSLRYHKDTVQAISFCQTRRLNVMEENDDEEDSESEDSDGDGKAMEDKAAGRLLVSGGKEGRICLWKT